MDALDSFTSFFQWNDQEEISNPDPTLYRIITSKQEYVGKIINQDGMMIKFKSQKTKPIKILKVNIHSISLIAT